MSSFMIALIPLILGLLATFGQALTISFFHPMIILLIHLSGILVSTIILPLLLLAALLLIVSSLSDYYKVTHLASLFRTISLGMLGAFLTIFLGVMSVRSEEHTSDSSHVSISYAVFCLKKKKKDENLKNQIYAYISD